MNMLSDPALLTYMVLTLVADITLKKKIWFNRLTTSQCYGFFFK